MGTGAVEMKVFDLSPRGGTFPIIFTGYFLIISFLNEKKKIKLTESSSHFSRASSQG
jgi:hypothetical protein